MPFRTVPGGPDPATHASSLDIDVLENFLLTITNPNVEPVGVGLVLSGADAALVSLVHEDLILTTSEATVSGQLTIAELGIPASGNAGLRVCRAFGTTAEIADATLTLTHSDGSTSTVTIIATDITPAIGGVVAFDAGADHIWAFEQPSNTTDDTGTQADAALTGTHTGATYSTTAQTGALGKLDIASGLFNTARTGTTAITGHLGADRLMMIVFTAGSMTIDSNTRAIAGQSNGWTDNDGFGAVSTRSTYGGVVGFDIFNLGSKDLDLMTEASLSGGDLCVLFVQWIQSTGTLTAHWKIGAAAADTNSAILSPSPGSSTAAWAFGSIDGSILTQTATHYLAAFWEDDVPTGATFTALQTDMYDAFGIS